jgi:hypothetical protein
MKNHMASLALGAILLGLNLYGLGCTSEEERQYKKSISENTVSAYEDFLKRYPESQYRDSVKSSIAKIHFKQWEDTRMRNTLEGYELFLSHFPESEYSQGAVDSIAKIEALEDASFRSWLSKKHENEIKELKTDGKYIYSQTNIGKWKALHSEWETLAEPFLTEVISYDEYGLYHSMTLRNSAGVVAEKKIFRSPYNPTQVTGIGYCYPGEKSMFFVIDYQRQFKSSEGVSHTNMFLCLDKKGRIIRQNGIPKMVRSFNAMQRTSFRNEYNGAFISKRTTQIYPCANCSAVGNEIRFVW